jgi:transposase
MAKPLEVTVKESISELKGLQKQYPSKVKQLQMLLLLKQQGALSQLALARQLSVSDRSVYEWRKQYMQHGLDYVLKENRGGHKPAALCGKSYQALSKRLNNPKEGFRSFVEMQQWLYTEFGIEMEYQALNKYVKRKFDAGLKVSRKSHVQKATADEAVFKKPVR